MQEAFAVADRFCVLRLGKVAGIREKSKTDIDEIVKLITGGNFIET
jgi:ABC-type sugar transport system ATPase subunit